MPIIPNEDGEQPSEATVDATAAALAVCAAARNGVVTSEHCARTVGALVAGLDTGDQVDFVASGLVNAGKAFRRLYGDAMSGGWAAVGAGDVPAEAGGSLRRALVGTAAALQAAVESNGDLDRVGEALAVAVEGMTPHEFAQMAVSVMVTAEMAVWAAARAEAEAN